MSQEIIGAWKAAIARLIKRGVTGRILLASLPSARGIPVSVHKLFSLEKPAICRRYRIGYSVASISHRLLSLLFLLSPENVK